MPQTRPVSRSRRIPTMRQVPGWAIAVVFAAAVWSPIAAAAGPYTTMYVAGDSLSDQGNLFFVTQLVTGVGVPASPAPGDNRGYYLGRFSNGEVYADLLAHRFGIALGPSMLGGNNFAFGGARTAYNIAEDPPRPGGFPPGSFPWTLNLERQSFVTRNVNDPG